MENENVDIRQNSFKQHLLVSSVEMFFNLSVDE